MDMQNAVELAYNNGYEAGFKAAIEKLKLAVINQANGDKKDLNESMIKMGDFLKLCDEAQVKD